MKRFVLAVALTCVLSGTALAGLIPSTDVAPPPPPPENAQATSAGIIPTSDIASAETTSPLLGVVLTLLSVL
jgi:hypothetical protein